MPRRRDPAFTTGHLCRFCGQLIPWGSILRIIRVDPDTPPYMLNETAAHSACLGKFLRPGLTLTFPRHWEGKVPYLDDDEDIYLPLSPAGRGRLSAAERGEGAKPDIPLPLDGGGRHKDSPLPLDGGGREGVTPEPRPTSTGTPSQPSPSRGGSRAIRPCAFCAEPIAPASLVRLRVQKPTGPVKRPEFDEQSLPVHFECLAAVSTMKFG